MANAAEDRPAHLTLYSRSHVVTDWDCPRKRFLQYEYKGKGIVSGSTHLELYLGTCIHDGLAAIATSWQAQGSADIDLIASTARRDRGISPSLTPQSNPQSRT